MAKQEEPIRARFERKFDRRSTSECWPWTAGDRHAFGYGRMSVRREDGKWKMEVAHRISYLLYVGRIDAGMCVLHACDNPRCVNPAHLRLGLARDNVQDMTSKGRRAVGARFSTAKLNDDAVMAIRRRFALYSGRLPRGVVRDIAEELGVSRALVSRVRSGKSWNHVND